MRTYTLLALLLLTARAATAQDSIPRIRVATYQLESYGARPSAERDAALHDVVRALHPDVLIVQGMTGTAAFDAFFGSAYLGSVDRSMSVPFNGATGNAMFYNAGAVALLEHRVLQTTPVGIDEFVIAPLGSADTLHIFTCALDRVGERQRSAERLAAARAILERTSALPGSQHYMFAGDLRAYGGSEPAYTALLAETAAGGGFIDPLAPVADWSREGTYSRAGGRGEAGRFDMILLSRSLALLYITGSYGTLARAGDDATMMKIARRASDHLPVHADFTFHPAPARSAFTPLQTRLPLAVRQPPSAFTQPEPRPTDFGGIMLQKSLEKPSLDIFGTSVSLASGRENQRKSAVLGKWWGPPPGAPEAPTGRSTEP